MIHLAITFCLIHNPTMCRTMEFAPDDGRNMTSVMECLRGGAIGGMTFTLENMDWRVKGWRCVETPNVMQTWRRNRAIKP